MAVPRRKRESFKSSARQDPELQQALKALGQRIRELRTAQPELTQEKAAKKAGLDPKHFQEAEAGRTNLTVASLIGVARALGVSLSDLFDGV